MCGGAQRGSTQRNVLDSCAQAEPRQPAQNKTGKFPYGRECLLDHICGLVGEGVQAEATLGQRGMRQLPWAAVYMRKAPIWVTGRTGPGGLAIGVVALFHNFRGKCSP